MNLPDGPRLVAGAFVSGAVGGLVGIGLLFALGSTTTDAVEVVFGLGALAFGFGLLGWSGSVMAGRGVETMQEYLDTGTNWTESKSRRAMARIGGFGFGMMIAVSIVEVAVILL